MGKRIRYPKKKEKKQELLNEKEQQSQEQKQEQPMHFVLDVHDSNATSSDNFGIGH